MLSAPKTGSSYVDDGNVGRQVFSLSVLVFLPTTRRLIRSPPFPLACVSSVWSRMHEAIPHPNPAIPRKPKPQARSYLGGCLVY